MVEHLTSVLLVGEVVRHRTITWIGHVWNITCTDTTLVWRWVTFWNNPLVWCSIRDPRRLSTVEVNQCAVFCVLLVDGITQRIHALLQWTITSSHQRLINREEEISGASKAKIVNELQAHRLVCLCENEWAKVVWLTIREWVQITVATNL